MGFVSNKLERKRLSKLLISLNESSDGLMHELSLIVSGKIKKAFESGEFGDHSATSERESTLHYNCINQRQGLILKTSFYKDTRTTTDLLNNFNSYTNAILAMGDYVLGGCPKTNFERVTNQYKTILQLQREGRDYFKGIIKVEKEQKQYESKVKHSIIHIDFKKTAT